MRIVRIDELPEIKEQAAAWFSDKWKDHEEEYYYSIDESLNSKMMFPKWYVMLKDEEIIAGAGVISNEPQIQKEKHPNICAVYVEEEFRGKGIAGALLEYICIDMMFHGAEVLYLTTELKTFYERYGWQFITEIADDDGKTMRVYRRPLNLTGRK